MNPAALGDIELRWRPLSVPEMSVASTRLSDAWRKVRREVPGLELRMATDADLRADVVQVLADAVIRVLQANERNGIRKGSVAVDDALRSWELDGTIRADLYFTDAELASLLPAAEEGRPRAFSVMPS